MKHVFAEGYRVFFLAVGIFGAAAGMVWTLYLWSGSMAAMPAMAPGEWHAHEMIFGFAAAAMGGFFLTAVPNWTGARAAPARFIAVVSAIWLAGRLGVWLSGGLPGWAVAAVDLAFVPVLAAKLLTQLLQRPKPQNMMFLLVLTLYWLGNLLVHLDWMGVADTGAQGLRGGLFAAVAMIAVLGGRVTPAFTRNALVRAGQEHALPVSRMPLERAGSALAIALPAAILAGAPPVLTAPLAVLAGLAALARLSGWRGLSVRDQPILWAMHLAYAMVGAGLTLWGLAAAGWGPELGALHLLGIGGLGGMVLAIASRASLGHAGRPLVAPRPVALGYGVLALAALARYGADLLPQHWLALSLIAGALWSVAFLLYLAAIGPVLVAPRRSSRQT